MDPEPSGSLESQLAELRARVRQLEVVLIEYGIVTHTEQTESAPPAASTPPLAQPPYIASPSAATSPSAQAQPQPAAHTSPPHFPIPPPAPVFASIEPPRPHDTRSLESRIGSQWFNRVGILAILIAVAWFLKLAFDNHWIGPAGRVLIGLVAGAALIAWSERFRAKNYLAFSYSLKAIGSGVLYLSLFAAFSFYQLIPAGVAFAAMIAVTAFNGYLSWVQDAELLALYAIAGGFSTPLLVSTGENHEITLFSYILLLDAAVLILVILRPWSRLLFGAFTGTVLFVFGWWVEYYSQSQAARTAVFLACFFLLFAIAPRLVRVKARDDARVSGWDTLALVLLPVANAALAFIAFYGLLSLAASEWAAPWLAVAFAAFYLLLLRITQAATERAPGVLSHLYLTIAVIFLTIAIPLKTQGRWLTIGWLAEGAALLWLSRRIASPLLRVLALLCLALGLGALLLINPPTSFTPIFNHRFAAYLFAIAVFAFAAWLERGPARQPAAAEPGSATGQLSQPSVFAPIALLIVNGLILISICLEIHSFWLSRQWRLARPYLGGTPAQYWAHPWTIYARYHIYEQFSYSAFLMLFGATLLAIGFWRHSAFLRWQALVLIAFSIGKVFLVDMSELSQGYRILSFLGLGALLLAVSFVYQRDWLGLRKSATEQERS